MSEYSDEILLKKLQECIENKNKDQAQEIIDLIPNAEIAEQLNELDLESQQTYLKLLKSEEAAELFSYLDEEVQKNLAENFSEDWGMKLLQNLQSDELADVLDELPENVSSKILAYTPLEKREELNKLLRYEDDEVGSIMSIDISSISNEYTCEQALNKIRRDYKKRSAELVHYYYVVDGADRLLGVLTLEEILFANPETKIEDIYSPVASVTANDKKEFAAQIFSDHDMSVLPVTNNEKQLIGMITSDDVIDVINDEATEDLYKIAGITTSEKDDAEYLKTPWYTLVKNRIFWLLISLLLATVLQIVVNITLNLLKVDANSNQKLTILLGSLIPVLITVIASGSIQANVTISRALALQEIDETDYKKVILKEFIVASIIGSIIAIANFARLSLYYLATKDLLQSSWNVAFNIQLKTVWTMICLSSLVLLITLIIANLIGSLMPLIYLKMKKDPSSVSTILLTNLANIFAIALLLGLSYGIFKAFVII
ncbi:magnesium transporter [Mycoplasmopsis iners]|uniref:magnesium transporter n=1 Tax=Mycoplasmopsis iners TaxID=76630 RepID=UPI0004976544|nr:magnesium transporter [Mycoplasmopsis iners]